MPTTARRGIAALTAYLSVTGFVILAAPAAEAAHRQQGPDPRTIVARAERGDPAAETMLGYMHFTGRGAPQSYVAAVDWYTRAAHQGDPDAQYLLGLMYDKGLGVDSDVIKAYKWLNLAAAHAPPVNRENYLKIRDAVASKMTPDQLVIGQKLALEFIVTRP